MLIKTIKLDRIWIRPAVYQDFVYSPWIIWCYYRGTQCNIYLYNTHHDPYTIPLFPFSCEWCTSCTIKKYPQFHVLEYIANVNVSVCKTNSSIKTKQNSTSKIHYVISNRRHYVHCIINHTQRNVHRTPLYHTYLIQRR